MSYEVLRFAGARKTSDHDVICAGSCLTPVPGRHPYFCRRILGLSGVLDRRAAGREPKKRSKRLVRWTVLDFLLSIHWYE